MTILVTRPDPEGQALVERLRCVGRQAWSFPLIEFIPGRELSDLATRLSTLADHDIVIAVSSQALMYAGPSLQAINFQWPQALEYYAIGNKTALMLHQYCQQPVLYPKDKAITENLLNLPSLQAVSGKKVLILRGNTGRELLAETLTERGAQVSYCECYQRITIDYHGAEQAAHWRRQGISTLIVTSGEMLRILFALIPEIDRSHWLLHCRLIVVSDRLATLASELGWRHITVAEGADNDALIGALR